MGCMEISSSSCDEIGVPIDLIFLSQGSFGVAKGSQAICPVCWGSRHFSEENAGELVVI